jgi:hypothetical protein
MKIDFKALREHVSLERAAQYLRLDMHHDANGLRAACPRCKPDDPKKHVLAINPAKGWTCHTAEKKSGFDGVSLVAHVMGVTNTEAAQRLIEHFSLGTPVPSSSPRHSPTEKGMEPLDHLEPKHPVIEVLGLSPKVCEAIGIGYAKLGTMPGRVLIPLRLPDGTLAGYMGIATKADQEPLLLFPKNLDERCSVVREEPKAPAADSPDALRKLFRVVGGN